MVAHPCPPAPTAPEDIDPGWLTAAFRAGGLEVEVASMNAQPITQNVGVQGSLIRYELTYAGFNGPASVVAKLPTTDPANRAHGVATDLWEREARFYRDIAPCIGVRVPSCYFVAADSSRGAYALILEDLSGREQPAHVSPRRAAAAMRWLGDLHGRWWGKTAATFPWLETERSFERRLRAAAEANWPTFLSEAEAHHVPRRQISMVEQSIARFGEGLTGGVLAPTLIHYDFRVGNMLFAGEDDVVTLDWQSPLVGQGTVDLIWFLRDSISPQDRRAHESELIGLYQEQVVANGVARADLRGLGRQARLSQLRRLPMSVLLATTFKDLAHVDDAGGCVWWAREYDELEDIWTAEGRST